MIAYSTSTCVGDALDPAGVRTWARQLVYHAVPVPVLVDRYEPDHTVSRAQRTEPKMRTPPERIPYVVGDDFVAYSLPGRSPQKIQRHSYGREIVLVPDAITCERDRTGRRTKIRILCRCKTCGTQRRVYPSDWNGGRGCGKCWRAKRSGPERFTISKSDCATRPLYVQYGGRR